jgi:tetratricopeptide (TPR) repeat protein
MAREDYVAAEKHFRQALLIYADAIPPGHLNVAIARAKLGRALLRQGRRGEARPELEAARAVLERQPGEPSSWLLAARDDLAAVVARN